MATMTDISPFTNEPLLDWNDPDNERQMEEALAQVALDISGRPMLVYDAPIPFKAVGQYDTALTEEFLQALVRSAGLTLHVRLLAGRNAHHMVEAVFKAVARALGDAVSLDARAGDSVPSTKGVL